MKVKKKRTDRKEGKEKATGWDDGDVVKETKPSKTTTM